MRRALATTTATTIALLETLGHLLRAVRCGLASAAAAAIVLLQEIGRLLVAMAASAVVRASAAADRLRRVTRAALPTLTQSAAAQRAQATAQATWAALKAAPMPWAKA